MADVIDLTSRLPGANNLITSHPLEFRRGDWQHGQPLLCTRMESARFEEHRAGALAAPGHRHIAFVPNHLSLDEGSRCTLLGLFRHRNDEGRMRRVYHLAGLMECVTNATSPVLRTDLLRRLYQEITEEREALQVAWRGRVDHFLLPLFPEHYNPNLFQHRISRAETLKELFDAVRGETDAQFNALSRFYVLYLPDDFIFRI
ncbi:MAG: hypothetical protein ABFD98_13680 [Syntrophobacteraceae bacterium]|nr:hypothetical protein [Desulfobacteraceae bacterium]